MQKQDTKVDRFFKAIVLWSCNNRGLLQLATTFFFVCWLLSIALNEIVFNTGILRFLWLLPIAMVSLTMHDLWNPFKVICQLSIIGGAYSISQLSPVGGCLSVVSLGIGLYLWMTYIQRPVDEALAQELEDRKAVIEALKRETNWR